MQYVQQQITGFTDTNLTDIYSEYNPATTYILETDNDNLTDASMVRYGNYYYRSLINDNLGFNPETYENKKWVKYQVSNKYAMLDFKAQSKSIYEGGDLTVTFEQNQIRTLGIGNYEAEYLTLEVLASDGTTVLWSQDTDSPLNENVIDYYTYIYEPYNYESDRATLFTLGVEGSYIRITFHKSGNNTRSACGYLIGGVAVDMGTTLFGVNFSYNSFAVKTTDDFGAFTITKRAVQDLVDFQTVIPSGNIPTTRRALKSVYDEIVMFIVDDREDVDKYENLLTLGVIQNASVLLENDVESVLSFSIAESV